MWSFAGFCVVCWLIILVGLEVEKGWKAIVKAIEEKS